MAAKTVTCRKAGNIEYTLVRGGVKNFNLRVAPDGRVRLSVPARATLAQADEMVLRHAGWIEQRLQAAQSRPQEPLPDKAAALERFTGVSEQYFPLFEQVLNGQRPELKVRDMTTRRGSCSLRTGTLAFARRLCVMPLAAQEYVVVHEFCHFAHPDHSPAFWAAVARVMPDYKQREKLLKMR